MKLDGVAVAGAGMVRFGRYPDRSGPDLAREAGLAALHDAGITLADVDEAFVGYVEPKSMLGVKAMKELGLTGLPVTHIENASATGLVAFREAAWAVASGRAEVAMAIGFDKMTEMGRGGAPEPRHRSRPARRHDPPGRLLRAVGAAPDARLRHHAARPSPPSPPRTGTTAPSARGATGSPTTPSRSRRCWRRRWCPSRSPR